MTKLLKQPFVLTPAYDLLLRGTLTMPVGLYQLHLATIGQLTKRHYKDGMYKTVTKRLRELAEHGYVQMGATPVMHRSKNGIHYSPRYYYRIAQRGLQYLEAVGMDIPPNARAPRDLDAASERHSFFAEHTLELNDIFVAALRLKYYSPQAYLYRHKHERELRRTPIPVPVDGKTVSLIPDALLDIRIRSTKTILPLMVEHDRGTESQEQFRKRVRAYKAFIQSGLYTQALGIKDIIVAFTTFRDVRRVAQMRAWAWAEVRDDPSLHRLFYFTALPREPDPRQLLYEKRWYTFQTDQPIEPLVEG